MCSRFVFTPTVVAALLVFAPAAPSAAAPGLAALYEIALKNDAQIKAEEARYRAELHTPGIARSQLLPQVNLNAGFRHTAEQKIVGTSFGGVGEFSFDSNNFSVSLRQTLFNFGQYIALRQSKSQAERARLGMEAARQFLILRLAVAYFGVLSAGETLKFARAEQDAVSRQLEQARERFEVGLVPITDVKEAESAYDMADAAVIAADNQLRNAIYSLSTIVNRDVPGLRALAGDFPVLKPDPEDMRTWVEQSLAQNLELLANRISLNLAAQEIELQRAAHYPSLDLVAGRNETDVNRGSPSPRELKEYVVGVELNVPIFSGMGIHHRVRRAVALHREALERFEGVQRETRRAAREAYLNVIASVSRVAALKRAEESARVALESNEAGFRVGTRTSVDVLLALKDLFRTRRDYANARYEYLLNVLRLKRAAGILAEQDVQNLDKHLQDAP